MNSEKIRPIAIYLPQYHPIKENDEWWGTGFTEWTNVTKARPLKRGHYQPHLPSDLGFYDLRVPETREAQAQLARTYGIYGFCYYHYWFNGRRIMERPFNDVFELKKPDFPFMLCWANENWTRAWDGSNNTVLLEQQYTEEDALRHIRALIPYFQDTRYIKIDNKPVFAIYRSTDIPNIDKMISIWRSEAFKHGLELYLCRFETFNTQGENFLNVGFDAAIEFQPDFFFSSKYKNSLLYRAKNKIINYLKIHSDRATFVSYQDLVDNSISKFIEPKSYKIYRTVCPSWDNSPRRRINPMIFTDSTPNLFYRWTQETMKQFKPYSSNENLFFINAWNEWAEGNHLEPDRKWGRGYLEAFMKALSEL